MLLFSGILKNVYRETPAMNSHEMRKKFLEFFKRHGHSIVPSSPLIPAQDPTLLFVNAGMNQFKDVFLGKEKRSYVRATSCQKCVRAGGKHNDLDQVGFSERHLTFFEMLGNFSFGDYFKKEAIAFAWEFLTKDIGFAPEKLYPSVFKEDPEAFEIWNKQIGVPAERITRLGKEDNFWQMGDTGPCGPCTEIYYDRGAGLGCKKATCAPGCSCERFIEIWNLVFMQYDRQEDGTLKPLSQTGVDTGMGLERLAMVLQGKKSVFETDIFQELIQKIEQLSGKVYAEQTKEMQAAFHAVSDHVRSVCLILADGGTPSNEGRGYVLRKILRRAALFADKLSSERDLFVKLAEQFITSYQLVFPELKVSKELILKLISSEVERFHASLLQGQVVLAEFLQENKKAGLNGLSGEQVFKLYDTYGFPVELTGAILHEHNIVVDYAGFEREMEKQRKQSGQKVKGDTGGLEIPPSIISEFVGYDELETKSKVLFVEVNDDSAWVVVERTPFYVESGGQVNDSGWMSIRGQSYNVVDLKKIVHGTDAIAIAHKLDLGAIKNVALDLGDEAHCVVNGVVRSNTVRNHTATHLVQAALVQILGPAVKQAGSVVHDKYLRFDFTYPEALSEKQVKAVEDIVNTKIQEAIKTNIRYATLKEAKDDGVISFFGEKYNPECVRVVTVPGFSSELCGGTHAENTGIIGAFKITSETSLSAGVRRLVAITGPEALATFQDNFATVKALSEEFKVKPHDVRGAVERLQSNYQHALSELKALKKQAWKSQVAGHVERIKTVGKIPFLYLELEDVDPSNLKDMCQDLERLKPALYVLINKSAAEADKVGFLAYLSKDLQKDFDLKAFATFLKDELALRGGGSPFMVQGGGQYRADFEAKIKAYIQGA
jgi:alanyl-tRNA synthetase